MKAKTNIAFNTVRAMLYFVFAPVIYLVMPYRPEGSLTDWLRHRENKDILSPQDIAQPGSG